MVCAWKELAVTPKLKGKELGCLEETLQGKRIWCVEVEMLE